MEWCELRQESTDAPQEVERRVSTLLLVVDEREMLEHFPVQQRHLPTSPERIDTIDLRLVAIGQELRRELRNRPQTLQRGVHVARVA